MKHYRCCMVLVPQSGPSSAIRKTRLLTKSLWPLCCAASCHGPHHNSTLLQCYYFLIVVCHNSSIDQLIFRHWKRLTQLSKHFFIAEQVLTPVRAHGPKFLDNNYAHSCCGNSLVRPTVQSQFVSVHTKYFQSGC